MASPFQGEAVERSETDEGAHGDNGRSFPLPPHPSFAPQMPPSPLWGEGKGPPKAAAPMRDGWDKSPPYMVRVTRRGAQCAPHNGFPLPGGIGPIGPRAATWGRPYENSGPLSPVGADLCVRPRPPCERGLSPPRGGDWGIPSTGNGAGRPLIRPCGPPSPPGGRCGRGCQRRRVCAVHFDRPLARPALLSISHLKRKFHLHEGSEILPFSWQVQG